MPDIHSSRVKVPMRWQLHLKAKTKSSTCAVQVVMAQEDASEDGKGLRFQVLR